MKKFIRWALVVLVLAAVGVGGYWYYQSHVVSAATTTSGQTYAQIVEVTQGNMAATASVVGQLEAEQSASLAFEKMSDTANLLTLAVQAGNVVTRGQVLATIDSVSYQQALDQANSDLLAAKETLADLKTPATALEIAQADVAASKAKVALQKAQDTLYDLVNPDIPGLESAVASAKSALAKAQANVLAQQQDTAAKTQLDKLIYAETTPTAEYNRLASETYSDDLYQDRLNLAYNKMMDTQDARVTNQLNSQSGALQAQMTLRTAQATLADAQEALAEAKAGGDKLKVATAKVAVNQAKVDLEAAQKARQDLDEGADATEVATAQAAVDKAQLAVSEAETALAGTQLVAPFDGTILETHAAAGDLVSANTAILTLANMDTLQVAASVDETTIRQVKAGQTAAITFDAFPGQSFTGQVLSVPLQGTLEGGVMVYTVPVSLTGAEKLALRVGMTANVEIKVADITDALLLPTIALQQSNGQYQVLVPTTADPNGATQAVTVEVGLSDGTYTQILKGLSAGDKVVEQVKSTTSDDNQQMGPGDRQSRLSELPVTLCVSGLTTQLPLRRDASEVHMRLYRR
jgi:HlyD family secretion protein